MILRNNTSVYSAAMAAVVVALGEGENSPVIVLLGVEVISN
jgi:hypothetical protein